MANLIAIQPINDGPRNHVLSINIQSDGSGDETAAILDGQLADPVCETFSIWRIAGRLEGFEATLTFGGSGQHPVLWHLPNEDWFDWDFSHIGGLKDPRMDGFDGTVLMTTLGLGTGDEGSFIIEAKKKGVGRPNKFNLV